MRNLNTMSYDYCESLFFLGTHTIFYLLLHTSPLNFRTLQDQDPQEIGTKNRILSALDIQNPPVILGEDRCERNP